MDNDLKRSMNDSEKTGENASESNSDELPILYTSVGQIIIPEYEMLVAEAGGYGRY